MSKLDDIQIKLVDDWVQFLGHGKRGEGAIKIAESKQAIKDLILELIGEDEKFRNVYQWQQDEPLNLLRAELRQKVQEL
jgi:hypothetical protein